MNLFPFIVYSYVIRYFIDYPLTYSCILTYVTSHFCVATCEFPSIDNGKVNNYTQMPPDELKEIFKDDSHG